MGNFDFVKDEWPQIYGAAHRAESYVSSDPRSACFYARRSAELLVKHLYELMGLREPYARDLAAHINDWQFRNLAGDAMVAKLNSIRGAGNVAVHQAGPIPQTGAANILAILFDVIKWAAYEYSATPDAVPTGAHFDSRLAAASAPLSREDVVRLAQRFRDQDEQHRAELAARDDIIAAKARVIAELREQVRAAQQVKTPRELPDLTEAVTRDVYIDMLLREAGWDPGAEGVVEYPVQGMPTASGQGRIDYVLWGSDGLPLAIVEAKRARHSPLEGQEQARLYADRLEAQTGRRPVIYYTNGEKYWLWDDAAGYPPREVSGFATRDELELAIQRRASRLPLADQDINTQIVGRHYQLRAIRAIDQAFEAKQRRALLVMATGSGKTRTVIALVDQLMKAGWVKRALFLADRTALVSQAVKAFKEHLPESSPVNLVTERGAEGRVYVSTYPTMLNLIQEAGEGDLRTFGPGYFDLVIVDEAHRSVYAKYGAIFEHFDSLLVGLTATPKDEVDHNTYRLFQLEDGIPTDSYPLEDAVAEGYLVPPTAMSLGTKFLRTGIRYAELSEEEKAQWDGLDWGDDPAPDEVGSEELNRFLFNEDTVDKVLASLMSDGRKVAGGERLAKTIIFAKSQAHAEFIERRFNLGWPGYGGTFARIITNRTRFADHLIEEFEVASGDPQIAISVDMLDTGIDVPEVANLVLFKPVHSSSKFWQMLGRGTRLCPDLYGPGHDKKDFLVFDWCGNLEYFNQELPPSQGSLQKSLSQKLFELRVELLLGLDHAGAAADNAGGDAGSRQLRGSTASWLQTFVAGMTLDNILVRPHRYAVEQFSREEAWRHPSAEDVQQALSLVGLPSSAGEGHTDEDAKRFDVLMLSGQLARLQDDAVTLQRVHETVAELATALLEKRNVPVVREQEALLDELAGEQWWVDVTPAMLEEARVRVRGLVRLVELKRRHPVYTDFADALSEATEIHLRATAPGTDTERFRLKARAYLRDHEDDLVLQKLRRNRQITGQDLAELERLLEDAGGARSDIMWATEQPGGLGLFIRSLVGLDRAAAAEAFGELLKDRALSVEQHHFVDMIIDELTANGAMEPRRLFEPPYIDDAPTGPEVLFPDGQITAIVSILRGVTATATVA